MDKILGGMSVYTLAGVAGGVLVFFMALILLIACLWGITYLISDILYTVVDPRVRLGGGAAE